MQYKIKPTEPIKDKMKFLFLPRYCEKCLTCFWLERVLFEWTGSWWHPKFCPLCGGFLWGTKKSARYYHKNSR